MNDTATIRARIHDSAIKRVTRTFAAGIAYPTVLLSFGENGWSEDLAAAAEDAAGMGMLSLARRGGTVSSRTRATDSDPAPGWRVELLPAHFLGETETKVGPEDAERMPVMFEDAAERRRLNVSLRGIARDRARSGLLQSLQGLLEAPSQGPRVAAGVHAGTRTVDVMQNALIG